ncbi:MAG TPA: hypothetical protein VGK20_12420 [Candidatus Binatia bacterium]|jgi:hypothetical protein
MSHVTRTASAITALLFVTAAPFCREASAYSDSVAAMLVNTTPAQWQNDSDLATSSGGQTLIVWDLRTSGGTGTILGRMYDGSGQPIDDAQRDLVPDPNGDERITPRICARDDGGWNVVWANFPAAQRDPVTHALLPPTAADLARIGIFAQHLAADGLPIGEPIGVTNYGLNPGVVEADVACLPQGGFFATWLASPYAVDSDGNSIPLPRSVRGRRFDGSGNPLGDEIQMNTDWTPEFDPAIASDSDGRTIVIWGAGCPTYYVDCDVHPDGSGSSLQGRLFGPDGNPLGPEFTINSTPLGNQGDTGYSAAFGLNGEFVVAFTSGYIVWPTVTARRFASDGTPLGDDFAVSETTGDQQLHPTLAHDGAGGFLFMWERTQEFLYGRSFDANDLPLFPSFVLDDQNTGGREPQLAGHGGTYDLVWQGEVDGRSIMHLFLTTLPPAPDPGGTGGTGGRSGALCTDAPATGCGSAEPGRLRIRSGNAASRLRWKWSVADAGSEQSAIAAGSALCVYEDGTLVAGSAVPGPDAAPEAWQAADGLWTFDQPSQGTFAVNKLKVRNRSLVTSLALEATSHDAALVHTDPLVAQLIESDASCRESIVP